ncbi:hypothetical protein OAR16_00205 [bacterium]|nr:hypothetical protein [bacterium]
MPRPIAKFTAREKNLVRQAIRERYGIDQELLEIDAELQLNPLQEKLETCPSLTWTQRGANFVVFKTGDSRFRCQFYYLDSEQFGVGKEEFDNLGDCIVTLLQVQADHELQREGVRSGMNAVDFSKANDGEDSFPPIII